MELQRDVAAQVFESIVEAWLNHLEEIEKHVLQVKEQSKKWSVKEPVYGAWSCELKLNAWAREGCRKPPGWISPEDGLHIYPNSRWSVDGLVTVPGSIPVPLEIKHVHNATEDKFIAEINRDTMKLATASPYPGLQVIACFDSFDLEKKHTWTTWLSRIHIWNEPTSLVRRRRILSDGLMLIKAWPIPRDAHWYENLVLTGPGTPLANLVGMRGDID